MAGVYRASVELEPTSGKREDVYVNTWHFLSDPDAIELPQELDTHAERIRDLLRDVYTTPTASAPNGLDTYISGAVSRLVPSRILITRRPADYLQPNGHEVWGSPDREYDLELQAPESGQGGEPLPSQLAAVLSFHSSYASLPEESGNTRPRARRRGRIYFGPLVKATVGPGGQGQGVLYVVDLLREIGTRLLDASQGNLDVIHWATYSKTLHEAHRVVGGHVDNSPDIQRRRKTDAFDRQVFGA